MATAKKKFPDVSMLAKKLQQSNGKGVVLLNGYVIDTNAKNIRIRTSLTETIVIEVQVKDIVHFVDSESETTPVSFYILKEADLIVIHELKASEIQATVNACQCDCSSPCGSNSDIRSQLFAQSPSNPGSGTGQGRRNTICDARWLTCRVGCSLRHSDDPLLREACYDSCDAARNLCRNPPRF